MTTRLMLLVLVVVLKAALPAAAEQDPLEDVENVPTPKTLLGLLPEGAADDPDFSYWLKTSHTEEDGMKSLIYEFYSAKAEGGKYLFTKARLYTGSAVSYRSHQLIYSAKGELESYRSFRRQDGELTHAEKGEVKDGALQINRWYRVGDMATAKVPLEQMQATVSGHLLPLVYAYHIRNASLGYTVKSNNLPQNRVGLEMTIEDQGSEVVTHNGVEKAAHLLSARIKNDVQKVVLRQLVLPTGEVVWSKRDSERLVVVSEAVSEQQVVKDFGADLIADPDWDELDF